MAALPNLKTHPQQYEILGSVLGNVLDPSLKYASTLQQKKVYVGNEFGNEVEMFLRKNLSEIRSKELQVRKGKCV